MRDYTTDAALLIGGLSVLLGFIALLTSRIYIDTQTNAAVEVEIPLFGKIKSNYPALALVFLGIALAAYSIKTDFDLQAKGVDAKSKLEIANANAPGDDLWVISGRLESGDGKDVDWGRGEFTLFLGSPNVTINPDGSFKIELSIKKGRSFEDYVQKIDYSNYSSGSLTIYPKQELEKFDNKDNNSILKNKSDLTRDYKPTPVIKWNTP